MATDKKRTKVIHIYSPHDGEYRIEIERETVRTYENGDRYPLPRESQRFDRKLAALAPLALPGAPVTIATYADLAALISACAEELGEAHRVERLENERKTQEAAAVSELQMQRRIAEQAARAAAGPAR